MPYLHLRLSGPKDDALAANAAETAAALTANLLGKERALTAVVVDFVDPAYWFVAGKPLSTGPQRSYHWSVSITDETNTRAQKARYIAAVHAAMRELLGEVAEQSYVHVADLRASAYGYGGQTQAARFRQPL